MVVSQEEADGMRIVIDGRMYQESGVGRYIRNLVHQLQLLDKKSEYNILHLRSDYDKLVYKKNFHKVLANFKWYGVSEQVKLPNLLKTLNPDLAHFPHFNIPYFYSDKFVVTIHDLIHQHFQMRRATTRDPLTYKLKTYAYTTVFKKAIKSSEKILVPSEYVKKLLVGQWKVPSAKVVVTYEGVDDGILKASREKGKGERILEKFRIRPPYLFYIGNAHPHKNVEGLIKSFFQLRTKYQYLSLVLSGGDHYFWQQIKKKYQHQDIIYTGFVSDEELVALYKNAQVLVMPSFEEGFGLPLLEAMVCGCPVVSSNAASLPEVGGDAAVYFDPHNLDDMVDKISQVLNSKKVSKELVEKGKKRAKQFSWEKLARQTLEVYESSISS